MSAENRSQTTARTDRLVCERLQQAGGLTLTRAVLKGDARWTWERAVDGAAFGYVAAGEVAFRAGGASVTATRGDCVAVPADTRPTVCSTATGGRSELLVGFADTGEATGGAVAADHVDPATEIAVVGPAAFDPAGELSEVTRLTPFPDASVRLVRGRSTGEIASEFHHHGDSHVFGYVLAGDGYVERGDDERRFVDTGESFHVPPGVVHRDRSTSPGGQEYVLWLTGSPPWTVRE